MKKILYILNIANRVNNFSEASMLAAQELGYEFHIAGNWGYTTDDERISDEKKYGIKIFQVDFIRTPYDLRNIKAYQQIISIMKKEQYDLVHCNTPIGGIVGRIAAKKSNVKKVIYQVHGFHFYKGAPLINRTVFKWIEMIMAHWTDIVITINQEDYEAAKKFRLRKHGEVYYVPGVGIHTEDYQYVDVDKKKLKESLGLKKGDIVCISMGDLIPRKNYSAGIKAIAKNQNPNLHYLICGEGPELPKLQALTRQLEIEKQIHFLGFRADIKELLQISDIFLLTTLQEGIPRSMMEAMASGLPCVASKIRGNEDLLEDKKGGFLLLPSDEYGFSKKIDFLADNLEVRTKMGQANQERVKQFDYREVKNRMGKIYINIL